MTDKLDSVMIIADKKKPQSYKHWLAYLSKSNQGGCIKIIFLNTEK